MSAFWTRAKPFYGFLVEAGLPRVQAYHDARVNRSGECWEWTGAIDRKGYGVAVIKGRFLLAHRLAWALSNGRDPGALLACHSCDNPKCVRPDHIWLGTNEDNQADKIAKGRNRTGYRVGIANPNYRHGRTPPRERT